MPGYKLTPQARDGLIDILEYVEERFGARVARRVLERIESAFTLLAQHPGMGHVREDISSDRAVSFWAVGPTLIAYRSRDAVVEILFVERGERDWVQLLEDEL